MLFSGLIFSLLLIASIAVWAGRQPRKSDKLSVRLVTGLILGTFIGGACTIGTAQLAFKVGMSAWWFSLGGGIGCIFLALTLADPLRKAGCPTIVGILSHNYGRNTGLMATILNGLGTYINVLVQYISATSILAVIAPDLSRTAAILLTMVVMLAYVLFGGNRGAGIVGLLKLILIFVSMILCGLIVLWQTGGPIGFVDMVHTIDNPTGIAFLNPFGRGFGIDMGACFSLIAGLASTQIYAQAVINAESSAAAKKGLVISSFMLPILGAGGILVGLWMRANFPDIVDKTALTQFILMQFPEFVAGIILGTLFICVIGTGAGLSLGLATVISNDVVRSWSKKTPTIKQTIRNTRNFIAVVLVSASVVCLCAKNETILLYAFLSMALRGGGVIAPLCFALWQKRKINKHFATASVIVGSIVVIFFNVVRVFPFDPLFIGVLLSAVILWLGIDKENRTQASASSTLNNLTNG